MFIVVSQQGGVGKTTIAAALVHDEAIRSLYEKIVWVSVGQEPDIRELQESIHVQLTKQNIPESAKTADVVGAAIRDAAKGSNVLLDSNHKVLLANMMGFPSKHDGIAS